MKPRTKKRVQLQLQICKKVNNACNRKFKEERRNTKKNLRKIKPTAQREEQFIRTIYIRGKCEIKTYPTPQTIGGTNERRAAL